MAILGEQNILDSTFKAFNSKEETSAKNKFSSQDFGVISNQFSTVFSQQVSDNGYTSYTKTYGDQEKTSSYESTPENKCEEKRDDYSSKTSREEQGYYYYKDNNLNSAAGVDQSAKQEKPGSGSNIEKYQKHTAENEKGEKAGHHTKHNTDKSDANIKPEAVLQGKHPGESSEIKDKAALGAHLDNLLKTKTKDAASRQKVVEAPEAKTTMTKDELAALKQAMKGSNHNNFKSRVEELVNGKINNNLQNIDISDIKVEIKDPQQKEMKQQLNEVATKASIKTTQKVTSKDLETALNNQNQGQNQQKESNADSKVVIPSLASVLSAHTSSKTEAQPHVEFNKLLTSMEQRRFDTENVVNQVTENIRSNITPSAGKTFVSMVLKPESLGRVNIELMSEKGVLNAEIKTENESTKELLTKNIESLKQTLQEQGVIVGNVVVKTQENSFADNNLNRDFNQQNQKDFAFKDGRTNSENSDGRTSHQENSRMSGNDFQTEENTERKAAISHNGLIDYTI